jgi:hypothetical protein
MAQLHCSSLTLVTPARCRMFSPISGNLLDFDVSTKEMVDPQYGWRRDLERACLYA